MHELSVAENIKAVVQESLENRKARVKKINLEIGKLHAIVPDSLKFCFQCVAQGTPFEGAELYIEEIAVKGRCNTCGAEFTIEVPLFICPQCGSGKVKLKSGNELFIKSIEIEEE